MEYHTVSLESEPKTFHGSHSTDYNELHLVCTCGFKKLIHNWSDNRMKILTLEHKIDVLLKHAGIQFKTKET